jgi:ubiquinone biosynthesis accessory factor UbiJ
MPATAPWLASAEAMFNRNIHGSSRATELARRLDSTCLQVEVEGITSIRAAIQGGRLALLAVEEPGTQAPDRPDVGTPDVGTPDVAASGAQPPADAVISGSPSALIAMLRGARPAAAGERSSVKIRGDAEIANLYRQFFLAARPDPEEELSRWIGDAAARSVSRLAGGVLSWARRARRAAGENIAEYLTEESRDLVARTEVEEFLQGVDEVREAADRVEARLKALGARLQGGV